jgi:hypothetical protein
MMNINRIILEALKKKVEGKESTGAVSAGAVNSKLSLFADDDKARSEYKRLPKEEGEFKEETSSTSAGSYDAPGFEDVNMRGNNPVGRGRSFKVPQIKGGGFVAIRKKCKTFPYCSQGDSKDKPVKVKRKLSPMNEAIYNVSLRTGLSVEEIKDIIINKIDGTL